VNRYQKIAWFNLIVIAATILVTSTAIAVEFHIRGYSTIGLFSIGLLVLLKFTPWLFKKPQSSSGVVSDERDDLILARAASYAWITFWWAFVVSCFLLWFIIGPENSVPTIALPLIAVGGGLVHKIVCSLAILVQYGPRAKGEGL
jgi:hypothetical protein